MLKSLSIAAAGITGGNGSGITINDSNNTTINNVTNITITPSKAKGSGSNVTITLGVYEAVGNGIPLANSFTTIVNQGDATLNDGNGSLVFFGAANVALNVRAFLQAAPNAAPYSVYMRAMPVARAAATVSFGLVLYNNSSGKMILHHMQSLNNTTPLVRTLQLFNNASSFNSTVETVTQWVYSPWFRVDVAANGIVTPFYSPNGLDWGGGATTNAVSFMSSVTHVGFGYQCQNANGVFMINAFQTTPPS